MFSEQRNEFCNLFHSGLINRKQLKMPLALSGIMAKLLGPLAYLGILRKIIFER
jgi:hypothetical protein